MEEMNNIYEAEVNEVNDLVPIEAEAEEAGMSTGMAMAIGGLVTAGLIFVGKKAVTGGKALIAKRKAKKAEQAAATVEAEVVPEAPAQEEPVPENA